MHEREGMEMRFHDHYERLRTALMEVALEQSNSSDRERWLALALTCSNLEAERPRRDVAGSGTAAPGRLKGWVALVMKR